MYFEFIKQKKATFHAKQILGWKDTAYRDCI